MAPNIADDEAERLASEIAPRTGDRQRVLRDVLERDIWPNVPPAMIGDGPSPEEQDAILGCGPEGDFPKTDLKLA